MEENKVDIGLNDGGWEKVENQTSDIWDPEAPGTSQELSGKLVEVRSGVGPNNSQIYTFEKENGEKVSVWGCTVLDARLEKQELGTLCKLVFKGRVANKSGKGKPYKNFEVYTKK